MSKQINDQIIAKKLRNSLSKNKIHEYKKGIASYFTSYQFTKALNRILIVQQSKTPQTMTPTKQSAGRAYCSHERTCDLWNQGNIYNDIVSPVVGLTSWMVAERNIVLANPVRKEEEGV